jgi:hypothetical protein
LNNQPAIDLRDAPKLHHCLITIVITAVIAVFVYSGRNAIHCTAISLGIAAISLSTYNICRDCQLAPLACAAAALMLAFSPFITEAAILHPALPLIIAAGLFAFSLWVRSLTGAADTLKPGFLLILTVPLIWGGIFSLIADPDFMSLIGFKTLFPMPVTESPYPAFAAVNASMYQNGMPVAVGYLTVLLAAAGIWKLSLNAVFTIAAAFLLAIPCFDAPLLNTPPAIWAVFPVAAITIAAANAASNLAALLNKRYRIRPFWIVSIPIAEVVVISYIMTY